MANKQTGKNGARGTPGPGRPKGSVNKATAVLKDAILAAAENVGEDGKGKDGIEGYLRRVAKDDVKAFTTLLGKVLPMQVTGDPDAPFTVTIRNEYHGPDGNS